MEPIKIKAVELVRQIREAHYEQLKDKTPQERLAFYREKAQVMNNKAKSIVPRPTLRQQKRIAAG